MKATRRSRTADLAAACRASHFLHDSAPVLEDEFAIELTSPSFRRVVRNPVLHWLIVRLIFGWMRPIIGEMVGRQRYAEDRLALALERGVGQYVILSAGLDSFALRRPNLAIVLEIFEIDHPASQHAKRRRLAKLGLDPTNVMYVPVDFERQSVADTMADCGFSRVAPAFISWLGTTMYLTKEALFATFEAVAQSTAPGSEIVFDYLDPTTFGPGPRSNVAKALLWGTALMGEPITTGFDAEELSQELRNRGLEIIEILTPEEQGERYFSGRSDGLGPFEHARFCCARVA